MFIIPHLGYLLTGIGLWVGAMILIIAVPFLMLDAVIELAVAAALLPAAIGAYAFKITRRYVKPVWDTFMNSMFVFMFVSLIALMLTVAFEQILSEATQGSLDTLLESGATEASLQTVLHDMAWWSVAFLKVCFVLILTWTVMGEAKDFAGQFSSSLSNTSIGSAIGTMGMSAGKSAVMKVAGPTAEAAANTSLDIGKSALRGTAHSFRRATLDRRFNRALESGNVYSGGEFGNGGTSYSYKSKAGSDGVKSNMWPMWLLTVPKRLRALRKSTTRQGRSTRPTTTLTSRVGKSRAETPPETLCMTPRATLSMTANPKA